MPDEKTNRRRAYDFAKHPVSIATLVVIAGIAITAFNSKACQSRITAPVSIEFVKGNLDAHIGNYETHVGDFKAHTKGTDRTLKAQTEKIHRIDKQVTAIAVAVRAPIVPDENEDTP